MALTLHYDFANSPSLAAQVGPTLSITRATTATMVDADGYIREVQSGEARFTGAVFNHNLLYDSNDFTTHNVLDGTITADQTEADPYGGSLASTFTATAQGGSQTPYVRIISQALPHGGVYRFSVHFKSSQTYLALRTGLFNTAANGATYFNVSTGAVAELDTNHQAAAITSLGSGWYRASIVFTVDGSDLTGSVYIAMDDDGTGATPAVVDPDGTETFDTYGWMVERVTSGTSATPGSYIPTTTAPVTSLSGTNTGLLVEEARTNVCLQSEDFSTTWSTSGATVTTNQTASPDGSTTADKWTGDTGGSGASTISQVIGSLSTSTAYTWSMFVKADQKDWVRLACIGMASQTLHVDFDVANCLVGATIGADVDSQGIEDFGNGWCRCWFSFTTDSVDTIATFFAYIADDDGDITVVRDGTASLFGWGAQLEAGAFPTSYIPTVASSVTRNKDDVLTTDVSWYNETEGLGSFYTKHTPGMPFNGFVYMLHGNSSGTRMCGVLERSTDTIQTITHGGTGSIISANSILTTGTAAQIAVGFNENDDAVYVDGTARGTDTATSAKVTPTDLNVGSNRSEAAQLNGHISEIRYYNERLDDATLQLMSTGVFPTSGLSFVRDLVRPLTRDLVSNIVR